MLPMVWRSASPYFDASGNSPIPTLSMTITIARLKALDGALTSGLLMREVVGDRSRSLDRRDRVLEDHVVRAALIEHEREPIEILDASVELGPVQHADRDVELLPTHVIEEDILNVRLRVRSFRVGGGSHQRAIS